MRTIPDYRKNGKQTLRGGEVVTYVGRCPASGIRLYESTGSNDPRGILGVHAVTELIADEYGMSGPTLVASWLVCNNDKTRYQRALAIARKTWVAK